MNQEVCGTDIYAASASENRPISKGFKVERVEQPHLYPLQEGPFSGLPC